MSLIGEIFAYYFLVIVCCRPKGRIAVRESILTIPINEIFEPKEGCPVCRMRNVLEQRCVEYIMGAAMMEPDVRIETNAMGFCYTHLEQMRSCKNRLSLALMLQTHLKKLDFDAFVHRSLFEGKNAKQRKISQVNCSCFVCSKVDWGMERFMVTLFEMYTKDKSFRDLFSAQEYVCLPHYELLMSLGAEKLDKPTSKDFDRRLSELVKNYLKTLCDDVSHYCDMYDYRNTGKDADWGNSKDSIERAIKFLTTR